VQNCVKLLSLLSTCFFQHAQQQLNVNQWRTQKISEGAKFRHIRVTSQINVKGSAEGTTILRGPGACPRENFAKLHLKMRVFMHSGSKF